MNLSQPRTGSLLPVPRSPRPFRGRPRAVAAALTCLAVTALAAGCSSFSRASAAAAPTVRVGVVPGIENATLYLAEKRGYFTQAGIDVQISHFTSVRDELQALSAGKVDVAAGDYGDLFADRAALQKGAFKILADGYDAAPGVVEIMTMPNSPITTPSDLANQAIGAPATDEVTAPGDAPDSLVIASATSVLQSYRVNLSGVTWKHMSQAREVSELVHGQIGAILVTEPYVYLAQQAGAAELVDACSGATAGIPLAGYFTSTSWAADKPKEVAAFRSGLSQADAQASMPGPVQGVLPAYAGLSKEEAALVTTGVYPLSTITALVQRTADLMFSQGMIRSQLDVAAMIAR